jgi:hypothetical protein
MNRTFDSDEERYFYHWLLELQESGYISEILEQRTYEVCSDKIVTRRSKTLKKDKSELFILTKKREYTPDFEFNFTEKARGLFFHDVNGGYEKRPFFYIHNPDLLCIVDIKGSFTAQFNSSITFPDRQSMLMKTYNLYVQKVIPYGNKKGQTTLFNSTFTPQVMITEQVYKTNGKTWKVGDSKLKWNVLNLDKYVNSKTMD